MLMYMLVVRDPSRKGKWVFYTFFPFLKEKPLKWSQNMQPMILSHLKFAWNSRRSFRPRCDREVQHRYQEHQLQFKQGWVLPCDWNNLYNFSILCFLVCKNKPSYNLSAGAGTRITWFTHTPSIQSNPYKWPLSSIPRLLLLINTNLE